MEPMVWVWLGITVALLVFEICTTSLTSIWFAAGSLTAFVLSLFNLPLWVQIIAFVVVSVVLLIFTRPLVEKVLKVGKAKTNIDELIGKHARVLVEIDNKKGVGYVSVDGKEWSARASEDNVIIPEDAIVEILEISGVKLIVKKIEE